MLGVINKSCSSFNSGKADEKKDEYLLQDLISKCGSQASFVTGPSQIGTSERNLFSINHYAGSCSYDITNFIEKDSLAALLDSAFAMLPRNSSDGFVSKLVSGPSLAAERHSKDEGIIVQAQVSSRPLRSPTPITTPDGSASSASEEYARLDASKIYTMTTQLNHTLSEISPLSIALAYGRFHAYAPMILAHQTRLTSAMWRRRCGWCPFLVPWRAGASSSSRALSRRNFVSGMCRRCSGQS